MASFRGTAFDVEQDGNFAPAVARDADGTKRYRASLIVDAEADHDALFGAVCLVTVKRAIASFAVYPFVEAGVGRGSLVIPDEAGAGEQTYDAILVRYEARGHATTDGLYRADAEWVIP